MVDCCVIVVGFHGEHWLPGCLNSLAAASTRALSLLLVDNGGNGDVKALPLNTFDTQVLRTPRPLGFAEANNLGLVAVGHDAHSVCFLNQDTLSDAGWLDACLGVLDSDEEIGAVSPLLTNFDGSAWDEGFAYCVRGVPALRDARPGDVFDGQFEVSLLTAAALVVRSDVLRRIGPFDPVFGSYYEDFDLCRRIQEAGYRLAVAGRAKVRHFGGSSTQTSSQSASRLRLIVRNRAIDRIRRGGSRRWGPILRQFAVELPRNLARGLARTPSSQPPGVQCRAHLELLRLVPQLSSQQRDDRCWQQYLQSINWTGSGAEGATRTAIPARDGALT